MTYSYDRTAAGAAALFLGDLTSKARNGLWELDDKYVDTDDYMGIAYFWNIEYKWELRDASPKLRRKVHAAFRKAKLKVDDESEEHAAIVAKIFGSGGAR